MGDGEKGHDFGLGGLPYGSRSSLARSAGHQENDGALMDVRGRIGDFSVDAPAPLSPATSEIVEEEVIEGEFIDVPVMGRLQSGLWSGTKMALEDLCAMAGRVVWEKLE